MRLWSIHPRYLDARGLTALWREGLLALSVLEGKTKGYRHHPQLFRFRRQASPATALRAYLAVVFEEARGRGYRFDGKKIAPIPRRHSPIPLTRGQLLYEWEHLKRKLRRRDRNRYKQVVSIMTPFPHPLFSVIDGGPEEWEKGDKRGRGT